MSYGIPYKGSKNIYAKQICEALPSGKRLVDLFAGGCAITDCAIRKFHHKWKDFLVNDIANEPIELYQKCLNGQNPVSSKWVSRDEFSKADWATKLVWSFGNDTKTYLYGKEIEPVKQDIETWIYDGISLNQTNILKGLNLPNLSSLEERYNWWICHKKFLSKTNINLNTQRILSLERLNRLCKLENREIIEHVTFSNLSYEQYEYLDGDVVYCDIPYRQTRCDQYGNNLFNHDKFWQWAKNQPFDVYVSERIIPKNIQIVLTKEVSSRASAKGVDSKKTEYLVKV